MRLRGLRHVTTWSLAAVAAGALRHVLLPAETDSRGCGHGLWGHDGVGGLGCPVRLLREGCELSAGLGC